MVFDDDFAHARVIDVCVDLCCGDVGVAEEFLDDAEVCASGEEVRGEAVSEFVWVDAIESDAFGIFADDLPDGDAFKWASGVGEQESSVVSSVVELFECGIEFIEVGGDGIACRFADGDESLFVAFAIDEDDAECVFVVTGSYCPDF